MLTSFLLCTLHILIGFALCWSTVTLTKEDAELAKICRAHWLGWLLVLVSITPTAMLMAINCVYVVKHSTHILEHLETDED